MPPSVDYFSYRSPDKGYESDAKRFPSKYVDDDELDHSQHFSLSGHPQHYADSEPPTRNTSHTRTTSSARRSRKTSSTTASALVKALLNDKLDSEANNHAQLTHAYDVLRSESKRVADAERIALEERMKTRQFAVARAAAQQDAARAQAELMAYKLQLEHANRRLEDANALAAASDAERIRAERAMGRMKRTVERFREGELARRAKEQGWKEGRQEALRSVAAQMRSGGREGAGLDHDMDGGPLTPGSNIPLPVPPPASVPIMSRVLDTPSSRRSTQTPVQADFQSWATAPGVPNVVRQTTTPPTSSPTRRRSQTPSWPVPPPASMAIPPPDMRDPDLDFDDAIPVPEPRERRGIRSTMPDHIIIRSPIPTYAASPSLSEVPPPLPQSARPTSSHHVSQPPRPPSSQRISQPQRPPSSQATRNTHISYPQQPPFQSRHTKHTSVDVPARMGSASANRIYSQYETSSESSSSEPIQPHSRVSRDPHGHGHGNRHHLPQQEIIVPRPASPTTPRFTPPNRPPSTSGSIPVSAAAFHRQRLRRNSTSSTATSSSGATFPAPSRVAQLRRQGLGDRRFSAESNNSVPDITIQPPSRPESTDTVATGITLPSHLTPFGNPDLELDDDDDDIPPVWGDTPPLEPQRPPSRTGFMYGPPQSPTVGGAGPPTPGVGAAMGFGHPPPTSNFGAPPPGYPRPPSSASSRPRHMSMSEAPARPGSAADYFSGDHHRNKHRSGREHAHGHAHGHRREAAGMGASMDTLTMLDPNSFHDPDTDPSLLDEDEFGMEGAATPRASAGGYGFDDRRRSGVGTSAHGSLDRRGSATPTSSHKSAGFNPPRPPSRSSGPGFAPPRPSSRSSAQAYDAGGFDSPRQVPLPTSGPTSAYPSRSGSVAPSRDGGGGGRSRKVSLLSGGINGRKGDGESRSTSRNAFGNTPFVRSNGLYDD